MRTSKGGNVNTGVGWTLLRCSIAIMTTSTTNFTEFRDEVVAATHVRRSVTDALRASVRSLSLREFSQRQDFGVASAAQDEGDGRGVPTGVFVLVRRSIRKRNARALGSGRFRVKVGESIHDRVAADVAGR